MLNLGITHSVCNICRKVIPAKVVTDGKDVYFNKYCCQHGPGESLVHNDLDSYLANQRYVKPAWIPDEHCGQSNKPCPQGCGFCDRHEQHLCMPIVEITSRCDMTCPICIADAGRQWDMTLEQFKSVIDKLIRAEKQIDVINISGGEPLLHRQFIDFIDYAVSRPEIIRLSISTNGLALLDKPEVIDLLIERDVIISLQFDGFDDAAYQTLRGRRLVEKKLAILGLLAEKNAAISLAVTAAKNVNTDQFAEIVKFFFSSPNIISMMIQPLSFAGRGSALVDQIELLTIADITKMLGEIKDSRISTSDFAPLPCSHPSCFSLAYYLMLEDGSAVSLNQLVEASKMMDSLANKTVFGLDSDEQDRLKDMIYDIWSGPAGVAPDSQAVMKTLRSIIDDMNQSCFDPKKAFTIAQRHIKSIFIHAFQDANTFDLSRVRRCCQAYPQPDGKLIPACVHNVFERRKSHEN